MKTVICDIDGTLADLTHRIHHVRNGSHNWDAFFAEASGDSVIQPVADLVRDIFDKYRIILVSGRPEKTRADTIAWLGNAGIPYLELLMRPDGDYRQDFIVKSQILDTLLAEGHEIAFVIDDRPTVVAMWRERGLTCLQCRDFEEMGHTKPGMLTIMVGPSGAGKSWFLGSSGLAVIYGIHPAHILSSDQFRGDLRGNHLGQSRNEDVFKALHAVARERLKHGLPVVVDATNLKRKDRLACADLTKGDVRYIVVDRPMEEKVRDAGWRAATSDLLAKHDQTFRSQIKDILAGDGLPNVSVIDLRRAA